MNIISTFIKFWLALTKLVLSEFKLCECKSTDCVPVPKCMFMYLGSHQEICRNKSSNLIQRKKSLVCVLKLREKNKVWESVWQ